MGMTALSICIYGIFAYHGRGSILQYFFQDKDFKKAPLFQAHLNPKASAITTMNVHQSHTIERAYTGQSFFWGHTPHKGDVVRFKFEEDIVLEQ